MDWSEVYTKRQWQSLKNAATMALCQFQAWVKSVGFLGEVQIAGGIGVADKLVMKNGEFYVRWWSYESEPSCFKDRVINDTPYDPIVEFKLTPEHFQEAKHRVEQQMAEKKRAENKTTNAAAELKALANSPASRDLLRDLFIAEDRQSNMRLILAHDGLYQTVLCQDNRIGFPLDENEDDDLLEAAHRFNLSAEKLRELRQKIEAE
jgi:hypothetical protein